VCGQALGEAAGEPVGRVGDQHDDLPAQWGLEPAQRPGEARAEAADRGERDAEAGRGELCGGLFWAAAAALDPAALLATLPVAADGTIAPRARAWAVRASVPDRPLN
jgi:hypothetical protein